MQLWDLMGLVNLLYQRIMGNPNYEVTEGEILFDGVNVLDLEVTNALA